MATKKQKTRLKIIGKNRTIKQELLDAGYALSTATKQPPTVMKAKGWNELVEQYLPDNALLNKHCEALEAAKVITSPTEPDYTVPDYSIRLKAVELGYKVKGKLQTNNYIQQNNIGKVEFILDENQTA